MNTEISFLFVVVFALSVVVSLSGCLDYDPLTGCYGTSTIRNSSDERIWKLYPEERIECLDINVNNCNGGVFEITSECNFSVYIQDYEIPPCHEGYCNAGIEIIRNETGDIVVIPSESNFAKYTPDYNDTIAVNITWKKNTTRMTFIKTADLR